MKKLRNVLIVFSIVAFIGCGGGSTPKAQEAISAPDDLGELTKTEQLLYSEAYSGYIVVFLNEAMGTRLTGQRRLISTKDYDSEISNVQQVLDAHPEAIIKRSVTTDADKLDARRAELEELSGKTLKDFNSIYHIYIDTPDEGVRVMRELDDLGVVEKVYPRTAMGFEALVDTPDLTPHQGYLYAESTHGGLNAVAAWNAGVRGENVVLVDVDSGWNPDHEEFPSYDWATFSMNGYSCDATDINETDCQKKMAHGNIMIGIMAAADNGHGITGMSPNVELYGELAGAVAMSLIDFVDGDGQTIQEDLPPGAIVVLSGSVAGALATDPFCDASHTGCLPDEVTPDVFAAIQYAIAGGVTVIEAAAEGEQSFDDPSIYYPFQLDLSQQDSGSILVGASDGSAKQMAWFSNYGTPVDVFAWGMNVASTSYPVSTQPTWTWQGTTAPVPPIPMDANAYFVDAAGGTSTAAAQVGAAAALIQSYAKQQIGLKRYLLPAKMKEILVQSGVSQVGSGGNIGVQPRVDVAMGLVDAAWASWSAAYPELISGQDLSSGDVASLRQEGLGIICVNGDPVASDPTCPDDSLNVPGTGIAVTMDFDGDDRADLVQWTRGQFKIDLASVGGQDDGFGEWDVVVNYPQINSDIVWPYVDDMNSDLRTDLVLYDKENGVWYIAYTTSAMLSGGGFGGWDHVITTSIADMLDMDPSQSMYCRPHPGDYDGDGWVDLGLACSDGVWYMEYSNAGSWPTSITYADNQFQHLSAQQLVDAPGWAYITSAYDLNSDGDIDVFAKTPDGLPEEGRIKRYAAPNFSADYFDTVPHIFGGNDMVLLIGEFAGPSSFLSLGLKAANGLWAISEPNYDTLSSPQPDNIWGDISCHPIAADYDGDGLEDRAVMCPDEWKISYSGTDYPQYKNNQPFYRSVDTLTYDTNEFTLPGRSYSGGASYETTQQIIEWYQAHYPSDAPPIPVDMVSVSACELVSGSECY